MVAWNTGAVAWLTLALINAGFAEQKNRSRWLWFLISLFVGPIATLLVVTAPYAAPRTSTPQQSRRESFWTYCVMLAVGAVIFGYATVLSLNFFWLVGVGVCIAAIWLLAVAHARERA